MKPTQEQVIAWAREARLLRVTETYTEPHRWGLTEISRLAALAYEAGRKDENEACAQLCDEQGAGRKALEHYAALTYASATHDCAAAIRARGNND